MGGCSAAYHHLLLLGLAWGLLGGPEHGGVVSPARAQIAEVEDTPQQDSFQAEWVHDMGRQTFNGNIIDEPSVFTVIAGDYGQSLGVIATVAIAIGVGGALCGCGFLCLKFGGNQAGGSSREKTYSPATRAVNRIALIVLAVLIVGVMIVGLIGSSQIPAGEEFFKDKLTEKADEMSSVYKSLVNDLDSTYVGARMPAGRTFSEQYLSIPLLASSNESIVDLAEEGATLIDQAETLRVVFIVLVYVCGLICCLMACAAAIISHALISLSTAMCSFVMFALCWVLLAGHFCTNVLISDICFDIRQYENDDAQGVTARLNDRSAVLVGEWMESAAIPSTKNESETDYSDYVIYNDFTYCPPFSNTQNSYRYVQRDIVDRSRALYAQNSSLNCPACCLLDVCAQSNPGCGNATSCEQIRQDLGNNWDEHLANIRDCRWITTVMNQRLANSKDSEDCDADDAGCGGLCEEVVSGTIMVWSTSFVASILFCCMSVAGILGYKRLPSDDEGYF